MDKEWQIYYAYACYRKAKRLLQSYPLESLLNPIYPGLQSCLYGTAIQLRLDSCPDYTGFSVLLNGFNHTACRNQ